MPSSKDRRRVEVSAEMYDRLKLLADSEERALTSVIHDLLHLGLTHYRATWQPHFFKDRFDELARQALALAQEEAQRFNHDYVGTEHLLLGLLRQQEGIAAQVLRQLWIDLDKTRRGLAYIMNNYAAKSQLASAPNAAATPPPSQEATGAASVAETDATPTDEVTEVGYTERMRTVLVLAIDEAQRLGHDHVGTEHLLLGLVREGEGLAAGLLRTFGALGRVREFTLAALGRRESVIAGEATQEAS